LLNSNRLDLNKRLPSGSLFFNHGSSMIGPRPQPKPKEIV